MSADNTVAVDVHLIDPALVTAIEYRSATETIVHLTGGTALVVADTVANVASALGVSS